MKIERFEDLESVAGFTDPIRVYDRRDKCGVNVIRGFFLLDKNRVIIYMLENN